MMYLEILRVMKPNLNLWDHLHHKLPVNNIHLNISKNQLELSTTHNLIKCQFAGYLNGSSIVKILTNFIAL
jgi:hypothetical protein